MRHLCVSAGVRAGTQPAEGGNLAAAGEGATAMTYDLGLLAYADAVPLAAVEHRYCLGCATVFLQRRRDQVYCCRGVPAAVNMRASRAGHARTGKRGRPRVGVPWA